MSAKKLLSEQAIEDLQSFIANPSGFVLLTGENGRGKSYAAMQVYEKLTPFRLPAYDHDKAWFVSQANLNMQFSEANEIYGTAIGLLKKAYASKLLVLDDLGTRPPSVAFMDFLYALVDHRYNEKDSKGTIITTNLGASQIRENFGDPIFSRICSGRNYVITGEDRRFTELGF